MKIGIITDTHYGARKGSQLFHDYFEKFYKDVFFPVLYGEEIDTVVHMGDAFDSRRGIEFKSLGWAKRVVFNPLREMGITMHLMVGNHDAYYKNTNDINSIDLLLSEYDNIITYSSITDVKLGNLKTTFVPWITEDNSQQTFEALRKTKSEVVMGHLELNGFMATRGHMMENGMSDAPFERFKRVYSGHYHMRSNKDNIHYLGNPYEMFWNDVGQDRGFHIFDTETLKHTPVNNPYRMFYVIHYEDTPYQTFDTREYENKIVKVIVRQKSDNSKFEKFIDKLMSSGVADLKIVENFQFSEAEDFEVEESENTLSILDRYIEESETELDKSRIQSMIRNVYQESCELV